MSVVLTSNAIKESYKVRGPYKIHSSGNNLDHQIQNETETVLLPIEFGSIQLVDVKEVGKLVVIPTILLEDKPEK